MVKRQLNEVERKFCEKNLVLLGNELKYWEAMIKQTRLNVEIAPVIFEKQVGDMLNKLKEMEQLVREHSFSINTINTQLKEGVEVNETEKAE